MDFSEIISNMRKIENRDRFKVGDLIEKLSGCSQDKKVFAVWRGYGTLSDLDVPYDESRPDDPIVIGISDVFSYRGYYEDLCLGIEDEYSPCITVEELLKKIKSAKKVTGYKGGTFTINQDTVVWVDKHGDAVGNAVTNVVEKDDFVLIETEFIR